MISPPTRHALAFTTAAIGLALSVDHACAAETGRLVSQVFLPEDYRGESQMSDVVQTPDGLIYGATLGAVHEYDGTSWRAIPVPTSWIMDLDVTSEGQVAVTGEDEFGLLEPDARGVMRYRSLVDQVPQDLRPLGRIWTAFAFGGAVYWGTDDVVLRWRDGQMHTWRFPDTEARRSLHRGGKHLYLASTVEGLHRLDGDTWTVISKDDLLLKMPIGMIDDWAATPGVVFSARDGSLWRLDESGVRHPVPSELPPAIATVEGARLVDTVLLRDGRLGILTKNAGVFVVNPRGGIDLRFGTTGGVGSLNLFSASQDREGGLWVGTARGTFRVELDPSLTVFDQENGAPPGGMYMIARHEGRLYACGQDGLYRFAADGAGGQGRFERVPDAAGFMPYDLLAHPSGLVVVGDAGLFRYANGVMTHDFDAPHSLNRVARSRSDPDRVFVGGIGFIHTLRWDGTAWRDEGAIASFKDDARTLVEDEHGVLWIGTPSRGVVRVRRTAAGASWQSAETDLFDTKRGLPEGHDWLAAYASPVGPLFTHAKGVSAHDPATDRLVPAPALAAAGVGGRYTYPLAAGKGQTMWMQFGYPPAGETPVIGGLMPAPGGGWQWRELPAGVYPALGFLGAGELIWEAAGGGEGVLWIQGQQSIVRCELDAALQGRGALAPHVLMRGVDRGGDPLPSRTLDDGPQLAHSRDPLRLRFASPVYAPGGTLEYQFRLQGYDDRWSDWTARGEAVFTNLPAGSYAFEVRARRGGGPTGAPETWRFSIAPQWWTSAPVVLGTLLLAGGLVWLIVRWRVRRVEQERARLEALVRQRTDELARERDRAEAANRAKTLFLASMSHELRTPLHAILGYSQLLGSDRSLPTAARERLQIVAGSGQHLLRLINEVLDLSKIEAGKFELRREPFDLPALLDEVARTHEARATAKGLAFQRPHLEGLPAVVVGDAQKLRQILDNLVGNAVKFTRAGSVGFEVAMADGRLRIDVSDTGPGIAPADLQRLFEPFVQAERGGGTEPGTGLGLAIARRLATLMQGTIEAKSEVGRGSRFRVELAVTPAASARVAEAASVFAPTGYTGARRCILAVDDTEENRLLFRDLLAPLGFEVVLAASADEALALLDRVRPDLILLDLRMPGTSGFALARILRADTRVPQVKILAASASVFGHDPTEALAAGCDAFISKPFLPADLFTRIGQLLGLTWVEAAPVPATAKGARFPTEFLAALRDAARLGDVVAVRQILARLRQQYPLAALDDLESAAEALDTDAVARLASLHLDQAQTA
ncbi:MAG: response regulator [Opitutaceae bacterium]|nr:response regulator [Opitutaceae bacterium]